jgi:hypothetical protein
VGHRGDEIVPQLLEPAQARDVLQDDRGPGDALRLGVERRRPGEEVTDALRRLESDGLPEVFGE